MAFSQKPMVMLVLVAVLFQISMAAVYKVGDSQGWTTLNSPDYSKWASGKTFHVGDTILFTYHAEYHNVLEVTHTAYSSCNATAPIATHTSGNDSITVKKTGHFYYICGIPGHCQSGQKVDIRVVSTSTASSPSLAPSPSTGSSASSPSGTTPGSGAPGPATKNSATHVSNGFSGLMLAFAVAVFACFGF